MSTTWNTKYGPRRVRHDPPTLEEAIFAARGLTDDLEEQVAIAAGLMELPLGGRARRAEEVAAAAQAGRDRGVHQSRRHAPFGRGRAQAVAPARQPSARRPLVRLTRAVRGLSCRIARCAPHALWFGSWKFMPGRPAMPVLESTPQRLVLQSGSTTLTLDKDARHRLPAAQDAVLEDEAAASTRSPTSPTSRSTRRSTARPASRSVTRCWSRAPGRAGRCPPRTRRTPRAPRRRCAAFSGSR